MKRAMPFLVIGGVVLLLVAISLATPRPYDPRLRAERDGAEPFDSEVLYRLLPDWLGAPVEPVDVTPFERLEDSTITGTAYVFVTGSFEPDPAEADRLLRFVRNGNTLVIAADRVGGPLFDALGRSAAAAPVRDTLAADVPLSQIRKRGDDDGSGDLGVWMDFRRGPMLDDLDENGDPNVDDDGGVLGADTLYAGRDPLAFPVPLDGALIYGTDSTRTAVISQDVLRARDFSSKVPTAVAIAEGRGRVVLASTPLAFTNAAIAGPGQGAAYLAAVFAYVPPVRLVLWDDTYKPLRDRGSSLAFAARTPALRWALWLVGIGAVLSVLVWGRRRQRPIPVVQPPPNAQREFARTVGRLFFVRGDRAWLAARKRRHVEDALRRQLGIPDASLSDATARLAAARAGVPEDAALALFARLRDLADAADPTPAALLRADRDIDAFFAARHIEAPAGPSDARTATPA